MRKYLRKLASAEAISKLHAPYGVDCLIHSHRSSLRLSATNVPTNCFLAKNALRQRKKLLGVQTAHAKGGGEDMLFRMQAFAEGPDIE